MFMAYEWLNDQPTNPLVAGQAPTRNVLDPVYPQACYPPKAIQPALTDYVMVFIVYGGHETRLQRQDGSFEAIFQSPQAAIQYLSTLFQTTGQSSNVYQLLPNSLYSQVNFLN